MNAKNIIIHPEQERFQIQTEINGNQEIILAKKVITTAGTNELLPLLPFLTEAEKQPFNDLKYASVIQVIVGYHNWKGINLNAFGGLVPTIEKRNILGALFTSSFFTGRAPKKGALISVFMGGTKRPEIYEMDDEDLETLISRDLREMMGMPIFRPDLFEIYRYKYAIPQYGLSSAQRFETINQIQQKYPGLILAGNIRDGIGMADRIKQARTIVEELTK